MVYKAAIACSLLVLGIVLGTSCAAPRADSLTVRELVLVDADGRKRAVLSTGAGGDPALTMYDDQGEIRASFDLWDGTPALAMHDDQGKIRAILSLWDGNPALSMHDDQGEQRAVVGLEGGDPALAFKDDQGEIRAALSLGDSGDPRLLFGDAQGALIWSAP